MGYRVQGLGPVFQGFGFMTSSLGSRKNEKSRGTVDVKWCDLLGLYRNLMILGG